jgi:hypothetical protein
MSDGQCGLVLGLQVTAERGGIADMKGHRIIHERRSSSSLRCIVAGAGHDEKPR